LITYSSRQLLMLVSLPAGTSSRFNRHRLTMLQII
jgi:hypothetical protein